MSKKISEVADLVIVRNFVKSLVDAQNVTREKELRLSISKMDAEILNAVLDYNKEPAATSGEDLKKKLVQKMEQLESQRTGELDPKALAKAVKPKTLKEIVAKNKKDSSLNEE